MKPQLIRGLFWSLLAPGALAAQASQEVLPKDRPEYNQVTAPLSASSADERGVAALPGAPVILQERAFTSAAPDEQLAEAPAFTASVDRTRLYFNEHDGVQWVRGATYKAGTSPAGFTYVPFLGSDAPQSFPTRFTLASASVGGREIGLNGAAEVTRTGDRIVLDRGPVEVIYDFSLASVEQSFALDVAGSVDDVTLVLDVETELGAVAQGGGFAFLGALGGVRYGEAVVFDGAGTSASVASTWSEGQLTLTVPASFLQQATGPILVDPIITTFGVDSASGYQRDVDVAYDLTSDCFVYVYEDHFSSNDVDIYLTQVTVNGMSVAANYVEAGTATWRDPNVATINVADRALVVATKGDGTTRTVVGRIWDFPTGAMLGGEISISDTSSSVPQFGADVGGSSANASGATFLVMWNVDFGTDTDIRGKPVGTDGSVGSTVFLDSSFDDDSVEVVISESTGDPSMVARWNVAYINRRLANGIYSIKVAQFNVASGLINGPSTIFELASGESIGEIDVSDAIVPSTNGNVYAVVYDQFSTVFEDTFISFCHDDSLISTVELQRSEHADLSLDQALGRVSTTAEEFVVSYLEQSAVAGRYDAYISSFDFTENFYLSISERRTFLGTVGTNGPVFSYTPGGGAVLASRFAGGNYTSRYVGVGFDVGIGDDQDITGRLFAASNGYSPAFQYCYGNVNSTGDRGFIRLSGDRSTTATKQMIATSLPLNSFGYFIVGDALVSVANPGGSAGVLCVGGTVGRYSNQAMSSGSSGEIAVTFDPQAISQPSGPVVGMSGQFWQFSLWHRDSVSGVPTSNFTNSVSILFE